MNIDGGWVRTRLPTRRVDVPVLAGEAAGQVELSWNRAVPWLVTARFHGLGVNPVDWELARDLLGAGQHMAVGTGDVRVEPGADGREVLVELSSPSGWALIAVAAVALGEFVNATLWLVSRADEAHELAGRVDKALAQINTWATQPEGPGEDTEHPGVPEQH